MFGERNVVSCEAGSELDDFVVGEAEDGIAPAETYGVHYVVKIEHFFCPSFFVLFYQRFGEGATAIKHTNFS